MARKWLRNEREAERKAESRDKSAETGEETGGARRGASPGGTRLTRWSQGWRRAVTATVVAAVAFGGLSGQGAEARSHHRRADANGSISAATATVELSGLPREAVDTLHLIAAGGPFPYPKDGVVFGNFERLLPQGRRGYYHEYTVPTPGAHNRGARRIVCGGPLKRVDNCYYSDDHYASFKRIVE